MIYFSMKVSRSQKCLEIESIFGFRAEIFLAESVSELKKVSYDFKAKIDTGLKFVFSKEATKIEKIFTVHLTLPT